MEPGWMKMKENNFSFMTEIGMMRILPTEMDE